MGDVVYLNKHRARKAAAEGAVHPKHCVHQWDKAAGQTKSNAVFTVTTYRCRHCGALKTVSRRL